MWPSECNLILSSANACAKLLLWGLNVLWSTLGNLKQICANPSQSNFATWPQLIRLNLVCDQHWTVLNRALSTLSQVTSTGCPNLKVHTQPKIARPNYALSRPETGFIWAGPAYAGRQTACKHLSGSVGRLGPTEWGEGQPATFSFHISGCRSLPACGIHLQYGGGERFSFHSEKQQHCSVDGRCSIFFSWRLFNPIFFQTVFILFKSKGKFLSALIMMLFYFQLLDPLWKSYFVE